jgi:hypothetical protein
MITEYMKGQGSGQAIDLHWPDVHLDTSVPPCKASVL